VKCRSCSSEIDDKAIVCYRCGAPTAMPTTRDAGGRTAPARLWVWWAVAVLVVLALAAVLVLRPGGLG
jgi:hypothetical protein